MMVNAVSDNNTIILKLLLKNGENVDARLVEIALIKNHKKALKLLLKHCDKVDEGIVRTIVQHNGYKELESLIKKEEKISEYAAKYALSYCILSYLLKMAGKLSRAIHVTLFSMQLTLLSNLITLKC